VAQKLNPPLFARNGLLLLILGIARISTEHQDARNLKDQEALYRAWLDRHMIAQAFVEGVDILSIDVIFDSYGVNRVW